MLKVLIATGGTGGHLFPAQQLKELLSDCDVHFAGHKLEGSPFFDPSIPHTEITSAKSKKQIFGLLKGFFQAVRLIRRFKPDVVVGFGSFHSFPILLATAVLLKKMILFEANGSLGKVNRFFVPFAETVALQFPLQMKKATYVPLLPWNKKRVQYTPSEARRLYDLDPNLFTILVFGGSQGAQYINKTFCQAAELLKFPFQVIHLTGKEDPEIKYKVPAVVKPFEKEMAKAYAAADMAVCRCGAGTTAELIRYQRPALLIPYPYAYNHQRKNGEFLKEGAKILLQGDATIERMAIEIADLKEQIEVRKAALQAFAMPKTTDMADLVRTVGGKK